MLDKKKSRQIQNPGQYGKKLLFCNTRKTGKITRNANLNMQTYPKKKNIENMALKYFAKGNEATQL